MYHVRSCTIGLKNINLALVLKTSPRSGRPIKVEDDRLDILRELLLRGATEHGWQNDLWTAKRVAEVIQRHLGVEYSIQSVRNRLGWTVQRPIQQEQERNEAEIQQWKEYTFPQIVEYAFKTGAHLVFVDGQVSWKRQLGAKLSHREVKRL